MRRVVPKLLRKGAGVPREVVAPFVTFSCISANSFLFPDFLPSVYGLLISGLSAGSFQTLGPDWASVLTRILPEIFVVRDGNSVEMGM